MVVAALLDRQTALAFTILLGFVGLLRSGELINLWSLVLANRLKMSQVAAMVSPYPTIAEVNKRAAGAYFSPRLFDNQTVKRVVGLIQKWIP